MSSLALLGGKPTFAQPLDWSSFWPPTDERTAAKLMELYWSRKWTAFDEPEVRFSADFARHHGADYGIFTINGTVTMQCALGAYGIGPGDEVIVPALTWYATAMAARYVGATPVFVDIEADTLCIDPAKVEAAITNRTRAIIPVHLYGSMADMDGIMEIARSHHLRVIEDCAHMHGGVWDGKPIGSIGDVGSFSFQNSKTMSAADAGISITNDPEIADRLFRMKQIGYGSGQHPGKAQDGPPPGLLCYPFRATAFQAVILQEQLAGLDALLTRYDRSVRFLEDRLAHTPIRFQKRGRKADRQGYFGWVMIFDDPAFDGVSLERLQDALTAEGVPALKTWDPVYRHILFNLPAAAYRINQECAVTEYSCSRMLWILHAFLGCDVEVIEKLALAIEKVVGTVDELRR